MVIIKTKDGVRFVNEAECLQIRHDQKGKRVEVFLKGWQESARRFDMASTSLLTIEDVESVRYVSAGHDFEFDSAADEVAELRRQKEEFYELWRNEFDNGIMLENFIKFTLMREDVVSEETFGKLLEEWNALADMIKHKRDEINAKYKKEG